jgi:hypothetical protein
MLLKFSSPQYDRQQLSKGFKNRWFTFVPKSIPNKPNPPK